MPRAIIVRHSGNMGNRMFQYMLARALQMRVPEAEISGLDLPEWGIMVPPPEPPPAGLLEVAGAHEFNLDRLAYALNSGLVPALSLRGFAQRLEYYADRQAFAALFPDDEPAVAGYGDDVLVINIRAGEVIEAAHPDYRPLPLAYYLRLVEETGLRPVFMGQTGGEDPYSRRLREVFADAEFVPHVSPGRDFALLRRSRNLVMSISSFSWLACWFSEATRIFMPVAGLFDPRQRRDVNLLPVGDARYRFFDFGPGRWTGRPDELRALMLSTAPVQELPVDAVRRLIPV